MKAASSTTRGIQLRQLQESMRTVSASTRKSGEPMMRLTFLEKQEQGKPKAAGQKEITEHRN